MKRLLAVLMFLLCVSTVFAQDKHDDTLSNGDKQFGVLVLPDKTITIDRIEGRDGSKMVDVTFFPPGRYYHSKTGRVEFADGEKDFDVVVCSDRTTTIRRITYADGKELLDIKQLPDGTETRRYEKLPNGDKHFSVTFFNDGSVKAKSVERADGRLEFNVVLQAAHK